MMNVEFNNTRKVYYTRDNTSRPNQELVDMLIVLDRPMTALKFMPKMDTYIALQEALARDEENQ